MLTSKFLFQLGRSLKLFNCDVVVATDTRISKDLLASSITSGCLSVGINVYYAGISSTPALIYYSLMKKFVGVMITASHNIYSDNGIKIINKGFKLNNEEEKKIEYLIDNDNFNFSIGKLDFININYDYLKFINSFIINSKLKIIIDCANGSTSNLAVNVFNKVSDNLIIINNKPNGYNINENCGSTNVIKLKEEIIKNKYDIGFAYDGDGDRVVAVDEFGNVCSGDVLIYLLALYLKKQNKLNKVVLSKMSNLGIIKALNKNNIEVIETNVGDKFVIEELQKNNLILGGEDSGHIILNNIFHTGDGILISLFILKALDYLNMSLNDVYNSLDLYYSKNINIKVKDKNIINDKKLNIKIEEIKRKLNFDCKIIIRPSGTEDLIRLCIMGKNKNEVDNYLNEIINYINSIIK